MDTSKEKAKILTVKDIQEYLGIGKNKAYDILNTDGCPRIKLFGTYCVFEDSFWAWLRRYEGKDIIK